MSLTGHLEADDAERAGSSPRLALPLRAATPALAGALGSAVLRPPVGRAPGTTGDPIGRARGLRPRGPDALEVPGPVADGLLPLPPSRLELLQPGRQLTIGRLHVPHGQRHVAHDDV